MKGRTLKPWLFCLVFLCLGSSSLAEKSQMIVPWNDPEFNFAYDKIIDTERIIEVDSNLQHMLVLREKKFVSKGGEYVTVVMTTESRSGWPYLAGRLLEFAELEEKKEFFSGLDDPSLSMIWTATTSEGGLGRLRLRDQELIERFQSKMQDEVRTNGAYHMRWIHNWMAPVLDDYRSRRDWQESFGVFLEQTAIADRKRSDWAVIYRKKDGHNGSFKSRKPIGTILRTKSQYARFLLSVPIGDGGHELRSFTCKASSCDTASFMKQVAKDGGVEGLQLSPPDRLVVERVFGKALPRMVTLDADFADLPKSGRTVNGVEILQAGFGEIAEDRLFWISHDRTAQDFRQAAGEIVVNLLHFLSSRETRRSSRTYSYEVPDSEGKNASARLYGLLGLLQEVFPAEKNKFGDLARIFSYGPEAITELVENPGRYRSLFSQSDPDILVENFNRKLRYEERDGRNLISTGHHRRPFWTRDLIRKHLKAMEKLGLVDRVNRFIESEEVTKYLQGDREIVRARPNCSALQFYLEILDEYSGDARKAKDTFLFALEDASVNWKKAFSTRRLTSEEAKAVLEEAIDHHGEPNDSASYIDLSIRAMRKRNPLLEEIILRRTGHSRTPRQFQADVETLMKTEFGEKTGGWYGFFTKTGLDPRPYQSHLPFTEAEVDHVLKGIIESEGIFNPTQMQRENKRFAALIYQLVREVNPSRPGKFADVLRFLHGIRSHYGTPDVALRANGYDPKDVRVSLNSPSSEQVLLYANEDREGPKPRRKMSTAMLPDFLASVKKYVKDQRTPERREVVRATLNFLVEGKWHPQRFVESMEAVGALARELSISLGREVTAETVTTILHTMARRFAGTCPFGRLRQ